MSTIKQQWELLLTALSFFSRIPIPYKLAFSSENLKRCNRYFPTVGLVVGVIGALVYFPANEILPHSIAVIISMITTILATGAFHEDGFADVCDAFGGGYTKEKIMQIMKDSNVGAYGAIGVALLLLFKFQLLSSISESHVITSYSIHYTKLYDTFDTFYHKVNQLIKKQPQGLETEVENNEAAVLTDHLEEEDELETEEYSITEENNNQELESLFPTEEPIEFDISQAIHKEPETTTKTTHNIQLETISSAQHEDT